MLEHGRTVSFSMNYEVDLPPAPRIADNREPLINYGVTLAIGARIKLPPKSPRDERFCCTHLYTPRLPPLRPPRARARAT